MTFNFQSSIVVILAVFLTSTNPVFALGTPQIVSITPESPQPVGTKVTIQATVPWSTDLHSIRICFRDTNWCQEAAAHDIQVTFNTAGLSGGTYPILVQAASRGGDHWSHPTTALTSYDLTTTPSQALQPLSVWTADGNGNRKSAFLPLDTIIWKATSLTTPAVRRWRGLSGR